MLRSPKQTAAKERETKAIDAQASKAARQGAKVLAAVVRPNTQPLAEVIDLMRKDGVPDGEVIDRLRAVRASIKDIKPLKIEAYAKHLSDVASKAFTAGASFKRQQFQEAKR